MTAAKVKNADINDLLKDLCTVIYSITGLGSTIGQLTEFLTPTDVKEDTLCPELALSALAKSVYSAGDEAYTIVTKIREQLEGSEK